MAPSVTYTGEEVALLAGVIAGSLPALDDDEFEVVDLLLDKALAVLPRPLATDLEAQITRLRASPVERFWTRLSEKIAAGTPFSLVDAAILSRVRPSRAWEFLHQLNGRKARLRRLDGVEGMPASEWWVIDPDPVQ